MGQSKINYGIDLGTTNSAIASMKKGEIEIYRTETLKDTMPSAVNFNRKGMTTIGDSARTMLDREFRLVLTKPGYTPNTFVEFKRSMGTDSKWKASNVDKEFTSEELSAEVLKKLRSFISDDDIESIVITVPDRFTINQKDATRRAAELAGFEHCELLQEPIAASLAYGIDAENKDGYWVVFDFGGGTFDVVLMKIEEGIMKVVDTDGDNRLGGKNLDEAMIEEIFMPYFHDKFQINELLNQKRRDFVNAWKEKAEEAKIQLSFKDTVSVMTELGVDYGEDDEGEPLELDITIDREDFQRVAAPLFQRAVNITKELIDRNNLKGSDLDELILVGGPTYSPVIREMLTEQIKKPNTSVDPMTVVARGAALYASTVDVSEDIAKKNRDLNKIQLDIGYESTSVEESEFVTLKLLDEKGADNFADQYWCELKRGDGAWSSGRFDIDGNGNVVEVKLEKGKTNIFKPVVYDQQGKTMPCEPEEFTIIQGSKIGSTILPYNIGLEIKHRDTGKIVFSSIQGLEKRNSLPATGVRNDLKTQRELRPGNADDYIKFPLYQGEHDAENTRAIYNEHLYDLKISGEDIPELLPKDSNVELTVRVSKSEEITVEAYFPYLDYSTTLEVPNDQVQESIDETWLSNEISKAKGSLEVLKKRESLRDDKELDKITEEIHYLEQRFSQSRSDNDRKKEVLDGLRKQLRKMDKLNESSEWPELEAQIKEEFARLESANKELGDEQTDQLVNHLRNKVNQVVKEQDIKSGNAVLQEIIDAFISLTMLYQLVNFIKHYSQNFNSFHWKDKEQARQLIQKGQRVIAQNPTTEVLHPIFVELFNLLPEQEQPEDDKSLLTA